MKKVLVTGAGGFIGSNMVKFLLDNSDYFIYGVDNFINGRENEKFIKNLQCNRFIFLDDCNVDKCMRIRNYLKSLENWKEFVYIPERNGFCGFIKID